MKYLALSVAALTIGAPFPATAQTDDSIAYTIVRGDTLIGFAARYMVRQGDYRIVQRQNRIGNPYAIRVGTVIRVPRRLLKFKASSAQLTSVRGQVETSLQGGARQAASGDQLVEGQTVKTAGGSFASLLLEDGSRISVPSNTDLRIVRLRRYLLESALDYDFQVDRGGARSKVAPLKSRSDRYRVRTPRAVSAVRGTDFQTRFDAEANRDFAEVDEGALAIGVQDGRSIPLPAGNGLAVNADGSALTEPLLPALEIPGAGKLQSDLAVRFTLPASAASVRASIAKDAGFAEQVADLIAGRGLADFGNLEDGNYFFRAREISANGLEGLPATYAFKRRLNSVAGTAGSGDDGWAFKWDGQGQGIIRYNFQLYRGDIKGTAFVDESGLTERQLTLSDLPDGVYYWRVGSVQYAEGETSTSWAAFEKLIVDSE